MDRFEPTRFVRSLVMYSFSIQVKFAHFPNHDGWKQQKKTLSWHHLDMDVSENGGTQQP